MRIPSPDLNSLLLRLSGLTALATIPFKTLPSRVEEIVPFSNVLTSRYASLVIGISLLYVAAQLARKKRSAYWLSVSGLVILIGVELIHFRNPVQILLYCIVLALILKDRHRYVVNSDSQTLKRASLTALAILMTLITFSVLIFSRIDTTNLGRDLSASETISVIGRSIIGVGSPAGIVVHGDARYLLTLLRIAGISSVVLIGISLFQPLKLRLPATLRQRQLARQITEMYSRSPEDYLKLWPADKHYYFYGQGFVAYAVVNGVALVLDGATGRESDLTQLRRAFKVFANGNGWTIAVIHADEDEAIQWEQLALKKLFIGSEAVIDSDEFTTMTHKDKHFRYVRNKAEKDGLSFELWQPPLSNVQLEQLKAISDAWLAGGKREYTFSLGYFDKQYLQQTAVGVLTRAEQPIAYANLLPTYVTSKDSIDHMRSISGLSSITMHYLLMQLLTARATVGGHSLSLGLAPLSKLEGRVPASLSERLLPLLKRLGSRYYSFSGLEQFKGKFKPAWGARYIVYEGGITKLPLVISAISVVTTYRQK